MVNGRLGRERASRFRWMRLFGAAFLAAALTTAAVAGTAPAAAQEQYTPGGASALATLMVPFALNAGELSVYAKIGDATAGYLDETGRASSTSIGIPLLSTVSGGQTCGVAGGGASVPLPEPLQVSTASNRNTKPVEAKEPANGQGPIVQSVRAEPGAAGEATTAMLRYAVPGLVGVSNAHSVTAARSDPTTQTRTATSQVRVGDISFLNGFVRILGGRWELRQTVKGLDARTSKRSATGAFTFDGITVDPAALAGLVPVPTLPSLNIPIASPQGAVAATQTVNALLEPLGVAVRLPEINIDPKSERQEITSLRLELGGKNFLLAPILGKALSGEELQKLETELFKFLWDPAECDSLLGLLKAVPELNSSWQKLGKAAPLVFAALIGVVAGGNVAVGFGGVATTIDDTYYPPLAFGGPSLQRAPAALGTPAVAGQPPSVRTITKGDRIAIGRPADRCESTSATGKPGCWFGRAPLAAVLSGGIGFVALAADEIVRRRRIRNLRNEVDV